MTGPIEQEPILIYRKAQINTLNEAVQLWKRQTAVIRQNHAAKEASPEQYHIIWLSGSGGLGKSTLLKQYREELPTTEPSLYIGNIIDWSFLLNDELRLRYFMSGEIDEITYFDMMYHQLSSAIGQRLHDFRAYKKSIAAIKDLEEKIDKISKNIQKRDECHALWKLSKTKRLKLFQWFARSIPYEQDADKVVRKVKEYVGEGTQIEIACIYQLYEELSQKLGERFTDYLQMGYVIGTALGHDLRRFADDRLLLIFFDTYECIEKGTSLLRNIIEAAGIQVGWFIAGRSQAWARSDTDLLAFSGKRKYEHSPKSPYTIISIPFQAGGNGSFSFEEVMQYFALCCKQNPSLPAITMQDAERILHITQGIPLAVNIAAQFYARIGRLDMLLEEGDGQQTVIEGMVERYLLYVPYGRKERSLLYGLAMLRRTNDLRIIGQLAGANASQEQPLEEQFHWLLHSTHAVFIIRGQVSLHQEIRYFLRSWLLERRAEPDQQEAAQHLQTLLQMHLSGIEKRRPYQRLQQYFEDDVWVNAYLDLIEVQFWVDTLQGFNYCLPCLLASIIYQRDLLDAIIAIGNFFRPGMTSLQRKQWSWMVQGLKNDTSHTAADIEQYLENLEQLLADMTQKIPFPFTAWTDELKGALCWKRAELYQEQDYHKAAYWYQQAIQSIADNEELREESANIRWSIAQELYEKGEHEKSLDELNEAIIIKFDFADANYSKGNIYRELGKYGRAITEYQYAMALDDHYIPAYINLGNVYLTLKQYQEAIHVYTKALVLEPFSATLYNNRALAYLSLKLYESALADYDKTIALQPDFAEAYTSRGIAHSYLYKYTEALADYNKAYALCSHDIQIAWMKMWANLGDQHTLKQEDVEMLIQLAPAHYLAHVCRAISLALQRRKLPTILDELEQAIRLEPEQWDHYFWKGMICCYYKNIHLAQDAFEQALSADLPPLLLKPLSWLKVVVPSFFETYAAPLLANAGL